MRGASASSLRELKVSILPFEGVDTKILGAVVENLSTLNIQASLLPSAKIPKGAFNPERRQFHGDALLESARSQPGELVLAITEVDLYVDDLNFVFGLAEPGGKAAVISLHRLRFGADEMTLRERAVKEAMHEVGHTLGLIHCDNPACVMRFSNSLTDTDRKGKKFCRHCAEQLAGLL